MRDTGKPSCSISRKRWTLTGQLQGVGFRPFVFRIARELNLTGFVRNDSSAVVIEAEGAHTALETFAQRLISELPQMARIADIQAQTMAPLGEGTFLIAPSQQDQEHRPVVTVDAAVCRDCLSELMDENDFRFGYGLINCTNCGPRYSIIQAMPYDRVNTTMRRFGLCEKCHQQYISPADRRFHAQPVACAACGPQVGIFDFRSAIVDWEQAVAKAAGLLAQGKIVAIKGIGGFHLACRADDATAVRELRARKKRDSKPFALMCANLEAAKRLVELSDEAIAELTSPAAPIVLAKRRMRKESASSDSSFILHPSSFGVLAGGTHRLGVMLPYTPIHHLLFAELAKLSQSAINNQHVLVMTSANISDEPLVKDNDEAIERLAGLADAILLHERDIERSIDDSVVLDMGKGQPVLPIRRARGYVPQMLNSRFEIRNSKFEIGLSVGGELKNTVAVVRGDEVIISHHLGDLKHTLAYSCFRKAIEDMCRLFEVRPQWIAHDLHPAYLSTQWAKQLAAMWAVPLIGVQHHHAHAAACLAEHGHEGPALAIVCDGVGYGADGSIWGGELLAVNLKSQISNLKSNDPDSAFLRLAHLPAILLPGGDAAARDTRRCAAGLLWGMRDQVDFESEMKRLYADEDERQMISAMLVSEKNCVASTAAGRWFDAVAALLGVCSENSHEAQAGMALEALAAGSERSKFEIRNSKFETTPLAGLTTCVLQLLRRKEAGEDIGRLAADFHEDFAHAWAQAAIAASQRTAVKTVALSGGVFCNEIVTKRLGGLLSAAGMNVLRHQSVPPNDGGIAFGQAAVASRQVASMAI